MAYLVLSRKYRPRSFQEVVGQGHITRTLQRAIESGRVAQAYMFAGTRGTGKTTMARILAKALNCVKGPTPTPCNSCDVCSSVDLGDDVDVIEIDGASHNSVEDIRELRANASYTPARARYKIYYIDEVHMLSPQAFNALLKVLEEPPAHVKFIFATTEPHKVPQTIQSRCQRFDFRNIPPDEILGRLAWICDREQITAEDGALAVIARFAAGSMRDAESLLDQVVSYAGSRITKSGVEELLGVVPSDAMSGLLCALAAGDTAAALAGVERILAGGAAPRQFVSDFIDYLRDCLVVKTCGKDSKLVVRSSSERDALSNDASKWQEDGLIYAMQLLSEMHARMARSPQSRGLLDVAIVKLARAQDFQLLRDFVAALRGGGAAAREVEKTLPFELPRAGPRESEEDAAVAARAMEGVPATVWDALLAALRTRGALVARTVEQHASVRLDEDVLRVNLPANFGLHKAALEKTEVREAIEGAVSGALGRPVRLEVLCNAAEARDPAAAASSAARRKTLREQALLDPAVRKVIEVFDASIIDVEE